MMNKVIPILLTTGVMFSVSKLYAYTTVMQDCEEENIYTENACEGIEGKREFFDKWYRPALPFYYTTIEKTALPDPAWIDPEFDPSSMEDDTSSDETTTSGGSTTNPDSGQLFPPGSEDCPPVCN